MKVIIPVSSHTLKLIQPQIYLIKKYWEGHPDVIFLGYNRHNEKITSNFYFHNHFNEDVPVGKWSLLLLDFLKNNYSEDSILLYLDDTFLVRQVNSQLVDNCNNFVLDGAADKIYLNGTMTKTNDCYFLEQTAIPLPGLVQITTSSRWRNSLQSCIWKTDVLKKELQKFNDPVSPWYFEEENLDSTSKIFSFSYNYPMMVSHVYRRGVLLPDWYSALPEYGENSHLDLEDISYIKRFI
jgi:hypothetical protein